MNYSINKFEQLKIQLNLDKVPKFTEIRLETSNICGYSGFMCPRKKMTRKLGTMSIEDLNLVLDRFDDIKYELDFHMHGYGEALLCEDLPEYLKLVTTRKPNFTPCIITTLGYKKDKQWVEALFKNGLSKLSISCYGYDKETYKQVHGVDSFELVKENLEFIASLQNKYNFHLKVVLDEFGDNYPLPKGYTNKKIQKLKEDFVQYLKKTGISRISERVLHSFGGGFEKLQSEQNKPPCSVVWGKRRSHIQILWDLNVCTCCHDYDGSILWGNLKERSLEQIYKSPQRMEFIKSLCTFEQRPQLCVKCSALSKPGHYDEEYKAIQEFMGEKNK
ncbi:MAG: radical SAM protein [Heliobacteriaceae bacterium]|jgi:MoaA/NifB/PqqE/SkfB family radical SAM enzyme|nr:radical SAM protein [Heliobacteriaceae bacterium]